MSNYIISNTKYAWRCELTKSVYWSVEEGKQPNGFHRLMQRVFFGLKWSKME